MHYRTKFRKHWPNSCGDIAICVIFKMAAVAILDVQKSEILMVNALKGVNMRHPANFHQNR